ncbi:MAG TPA: helix-turn-helix domain-containing protein [Actinomycetota bacterium]|nr:helix-turn-helix domain-containing protein [Actinomycetota bacterium]
MRAVGSGHRAEDVRDLGPWAAEPAALAESRTGLDATPAPRHGLGAAPGVGHGLGVGPRLRKARLARGKSVEEASRETRIRAEYLRALERDRFDQLPGHVYVRGFLRSYASYLGLDPDEVLALCDRRSAAPGGREAEADAPAVPPRPLPRAALHPSWPALVAVAVAVLAAFGAVGLLSRSRVTPPAPVPSAPSSGTPVGPPPTLTVGVQALRPVALEVEADGRVVFRGTLRKDESRSFEANDLIRLRLGRGGVALVTLNGVPAGTPGTKDRPLVLSYRAEDVPRRTPSPLVTVQSDGTRRPPSGSSP